MGWYSRSEVLGVSWLIVPPCAILAPSVASYRSAPESESKQPDPDILAFIRLRTRPYLRQAVSRGEAFLRLAVERTQFWNLSTT